MVMMISDFPFYTLHNGEGGLVIIMETGEDGD